MEFLEIQESTGECLSTLSLKRFEEISTPFEKWRGHSRDNSITFIFKKTCNQTLKSWSDTRESNNQSSGCTLPDSKSQRCTCRGQAQRPRPSKIEAQSLAEEVGSYSFSVSAVVWHDILTNIRDVSKLLQSETMQRDVIVALLRKTEVSLFSCGDTGFTCHCHYCHCLRKMEFCISAWQRMSLLCPGGKCFRLWWNWEDVLVYLSTSLTCPMKS